MPVYELFFRLMLLLLVVLEAGLLRKLYRSVCLIIGRVVPDYELFFRLMLLLLLVLEEGLVR